MTQYIIRAEINNGEDDDWDNLHTKLKEKQIFRVIESDEPIWYDLPTGTYHTATELSRRSLADIVKQALTDVIKVKPKNSKGKIKKSEFIVGQTKGFTFNLPKNTDSSKLPELTKL